MIEVDFAEFERQQAEFNALQAQIKQQQEERERKISSLLESYNEQTIPSDKIGQLFRVVKLGEIEIMREYIPDPNPQGTADNPYEYVSGITLLPNAYYMYDGIRYVFVGISQRVAVDWNIDSIDMEQF